MLKSVIINHSTSFPFNLHKLFTNSDIVEYTHFNKSHIESYDYIILSGGEINISGDNDLIEEKEWLRETKKPILGICLGMQILSILEGEKLLTIGNRITGKQTFDLFGINGEMTYDHGWYIPNIPKNYNGFIRNDRLDCIYSKNRLAVQGHPELSGKLGIKIKDLFLSKFI